MKLWQLLDALKSVDQSAEVSIGLRDSSTEYFEVTGNNGAYSVELTIDPEMFAMPFDPRMGDLEEELDDKRSNLNHLENKARILLRNLKEPSEGLTAAERTVLLNTAIEDLESFLKDITT